MVNEKNVFQVIHIFKNHPMNFVSLLKDLFNCDEDKCRQIRNEYNLHGYKHLIPKKPRNMDKSKDLTILKLYKIEVDEVAMSLAVPYGLGKEKDVKKIIDKFKSKGYTVQHKTFTE